MYCVFFFTFTLTHQLHFSGDSAGDQITGRFVSGLPMSTPEGNTLPPFFVNNNIGDGDGNRDDLIQQAIEEIFPTLRTELAHVAEFCLTSLVYHAQWMKESLPKVQFVILFVCVAFHF